MESFESATRYSHTISEYQSLFQRKSSCPTITNSDSLVVVDLPFQQQQLIGDTPQVTVVHESCDGNTTSSQLSCGITSATDVRDQPFSIRVAERDTSSLPNIPDLYRAEQPLNIRPDSNGTICATNVPQNHRMSCWQKWWHTVCKTACITNKSGRLFAFPSSFGHSLRCCMSSSTGNLCCLARSSSSRCRCRLAEWPRRRLPNENLLVLSIIQILCGFASIILSSVALTKTVFLYQIAAGMWAGLLMLFTGTQGLITARRPISCTLIGLLIFCLLVTLASCALICISVAGIIEDGFLDRHTSKSTAFQYRHFTKQSPERHYPNSGDVTMIIPAEVPISQIPMKRLNGSSILQWARSRISYVSRQTSSVDTSLRTCQVILHVLLLLVGIMESSVSLSTSAICYKCLYSWYSQSYSTGQSGILPGSGTPLPTSIISFNADTANQAASLLQSRDMQQFAQAGGVLLAVAANSQSGIQQDGNNLTRPDDSLTRPYIHHTAEPFLSDRKTGKALILTEAGSVANAWTAVQAAAALLNRDSASGLNESPAHADVLETSHAPSFLSFLSGGNRNRGNGQSNRRDGRPRLLLTSLPSPQSPRQNTSDSSRTVEENETTIHPNRRTTMLYVMPSPSREEPPMVFPPFPPPYSDLQRRPSSNPLRCLYPPDNNSGRSRRSWPSVMQGEEVGDRPPWTGNTHSTSQSYLGRLLHRLLQGRRRRGRRRNLDSRSRIDRLRPNVGHSTRASALICAGDRVLQPVLIVEDSESTTDPPSYSTIDLGAPND